jgi:acyl dehydratase
MEVASEARVVGVWPTPAGLTVIVKVVTSEDGVTPLNEQYFSVLVPSEVRPDGHGERFPQHRMPEGLSDTPPVAERNYGLDLTLGRRYAEASEDFSPYTFDEEAAQDRGLPGIIVGGICTLSFAARAAVEALSRGDATALKRIALRFSNLLILSEHQELSFRFWRDATEAEGVFRFEAYDKDGNAVANHGLVELAA